MKVIHYRVSQHELCVSINLLWTNNSRDPVTTCHAILQHLQHCGAWCSHALIDCMVWDGMSLLKTKLLHWTHVLQGTTAIKDFKNLEFLWKYNLLQPTITEDVRPILWELKTYGFNKAWERKIPRAKTGWNKKFDMVKKTNTINHGPSNVRAQS